MKPSNQPDMPTIPILGTQLPSMWDTNIDVRVDNIIHYILGTPVSQLVPESFSYKADDGWHIQGKRYRHNNITFDITGGNHTRFLEYSVHVDNPAETLDRTYRNPSYIPASSQSAIHSITMSENTMRESCYQDGEFHGPRTAFKDNILENQTHYYHGQIHNPYGPAKLQRGQREEYWIHGTNVTPNPLSWERVVLVHTIRTKSHRILANCVRHSNPTIAYFAAHNPYCPETAKAEYALTRREDFPK